MQGLYAVRNAVGRIGNPSYVGVVLLGLLVGLVGCGGEETANAPSMNISSAQKTAGGRTPQAALVQEFLDAIQKGDRASAQKLLTTKAVAEINKHGVNFLPEPVEGGSFRIGKTVQSGSNYFVQCVYTVEDQGQTSTENLQWMVKQEDGAKWGIFGMAIHDADGQPRVVNFEQDLLVPAEASGVQQATHTGAPGEAAAQQASAPQDPFQSAPVNR